MRVALESAVEQGWVRDADTARGWIEGQLAHGLAALDLPVLAPAYAHGVWTDVDLMQTIATLPVPVVFAMQGHAMAGGLLLALFSDYRILPRGPFKTGLNEVQVGLIAPTPVHQALVRLVGPNVAARMLVSGAVVPAEEADRVADSGRRAVFDGVELPELALPEGAPVSSAYAVLGWLGLSAAPPGALPCRSGPV